MNEKFQNFTLQDYKRYQDKQNHEEYLEMLAEVGQKHIEELDKDIVQPCVEEFIEKRSKEHYTFIGAIDTLIAFEDVGLGPYLPFKLVNKVNENIKMFNEVFDILDIPFQTLNYRFYIHDDEMEITSDHGDILSVYKGPLAFRIDVRNEGEVAIYIDVEHLGVKNFTELAARAGLTKEEKRAIGNGNNRYLSFYLHFPEDKQKLEAMAPGLRKLAPVVAELGK